jgi:hypothetical protein
MLSRSEWSFSLRWVVVTTIGWIFGFAVCEIVVKPIIYTFTHFPSDGAVVGIAIGIGQWFLLRLVNRGGYRTAWWALASSVGFAIGKDLADMLASGVSGPAAIWLGGLVIGGSLGVVEWLVLRRHASAAGWWIVASAIAWMIGWAVINVVDSETAGAAAYVVGAIGAAIAGVITGATLARLMRRPTARIEAPAR